MKSFKKVKGELSEVTSKDSVQSTELVQLEQLMSTLRETIDESQKLGRVDLLQISEAEDIEEAARLQLETGHKQAVNNKLSQLLRARSEQKHSGPVSDTQDIQLSSGDDLDEFQRDEETSAVELV